MAFTLSPGNHADISQAPAPTRLLADKGYDANSLHDRLAAIKTEAVIPSTRSRKAPIPYDTEKVLDRMREPATARRLAATGSDLEAVKRMFIEGRPKILNDGAAVPARSPNTDFFPRDEFYLTRP